MEVKINDKPIDTGALVREKRLIQIVSIASLMMTSVTNGEVNY